jgi:hypothetical protein
MQPEPVEIRAFVNQRDADAKTRIRDNKAFAGAVAFFGHGSPDPHGMKAGAHAAAASPTAGHDHHAPRPAPQPGVKERFDLELDITKFLDDSSTDDVSLKLVAVDGSGNEVPADQLILEEVVIEVE